MFPLLLFLSAFFSLFGSSENGYQISGKVAGISQGKCYLGYYFASEKQVIYVDTAQINANGIFDFSSKNTLLTGQYFVEFPQKQRLDLVINHEQNFQFQTNFHHLTDSIHFQNSLENQAYYDYLHYVRPRQMLLGSKIPIEQKTKIAEELNQFSNDFYQKNAQLLATKILRATEAFPVPNFVLPNGKKDSVKVFYYYKNHFFDNLDLADERLIRTNLVENKLTQYLDKLTYQVTDSLIKSVDAVMKIAQVAAFRKYFASQIAAKYRTPPFIGADAIFVHAIDKYYTAEPQLWDATALRQMTERAEILRPLLVGKQIPEINVVGIDGKNYSLYQVSAKYTILYIYSLDCPHCKEHAPKMAVFQAKMATKGVKVFALVVERDDKKWRNFIETYHTQNLLNTMDAQHKIDFLKQFDVLEYPTDFVLDSQKRIIAKHINPALLEGFLKYYEGLKK